MPAVICPACEEPTILPDDWGRPRFKCPHCSAVVSLARAADRTSRVETRDRTTAGDSFGQAFGGTVGRAFGCAFAVVALIVALGVLAALSGGR